MKTSINNYTKEEVDKSIEVLTWFVDHPEKIDLVTKDQKGKLFAALGKFSMPKSKAELKKLREQRKKAKKSRDNEKDYLLIQETGIRKARAKNIFLAPEQLIDCENKTMPKLTKAKTCYVCKKVYHQLHHFYDNICVSCGDFNYAKRFQKADLSKQIILVTGARVKIGYQIALILLRLGAKVIATTRFPVDAALRFSKEKDFNIWKDKLSIHGLDLRHIPSVELFCKFIEMEYKQLDVLINNAAQTIRKPAGFYKHLMPNEEKVKSELPNCIQQLLNNHYQAIEGFYEKSRGLTVLNKKSQNAIGLTKSAHLSQETYAFDEKFNDSELFPVGQFDADLQQVDLRTENSWSLPLGQIEPLEMMEVQLINSIAPFVLCNRLSHLMQREKTDMKHIINVSAMEGKFKDKYKSENHPHTNMAKAGLNMLTRTSSANFAKKGIYMNSVDTGWVTNENPFPIVKKMKADYNFEPPLDIVDGAARVLDPLLNGINTGNHVYGQFLKDYLPTDW